MEIEIDSKKNNPLLKRTEVYFTVKHTGEGTPNREIIRNELAEKLNSKKENVVVNIMKPGFGIQETTGYAKVYSSLESSKGLEREHILKRNKLGETKKDKKEAKTSEASAGETSAPKTTPAHPQAKTKESEEPKADEAIKQSEPPKTAPTTKETKQKESKNQEKP
ncbi:MAG: 30S ribosomal protein S24e [Candidatus Thermoplasmatota archaeon]|nr:30S ribosomal protein S24e [Candidatus Thermoplasmatota archaeon]